MADWRTCRGLTDYGRPTMTDRDRGLHPPPCRLFTRCRNPQRQRMICAMKVKGAPGPSMGRGRDACRDAKSMLTVCIRDRVVCVKGGTCIQSVGDTQSPHTTVPDLQPTFYPATDICGLRLRELRPTSHDAYRYHFFAHRHRDRSSLERGVPRLCASGNVRAT